MTEVRKPTTIERERVANRIRVIQTRLKLSERSQKRSQYHRKEDFYRNVSDTVKALGYSLLSVDASKLADTEAKFDAFVAKAETALIAIVNDCLIAINVLEDNVKTVRAEATKTLDTLLEELNKDEQEDSGYFSSCSSMAAPSRCQVSTRKITKMIREKVSTSSSKEKKDRDKKPVAKSRSVSSMSSGRTYVVGSQKPSQDVVQRKYYMKEREAMFEERKSRPVVHLPKVVAKGAWGQTWHMKMVERKRLSLVDIRSRNKYAENRMGDSFQVFKEVKAIWKSNMMCGKEDRGEDGKTEGATTRSMSAQRRESSVKREERGATEEKVVSITQYEDFDEFPRWVKRVQKKVV